MRVIRLTTDGTLLLLYCLVPMFLFYSLVSRRDQIQIIQAWMAQTLADI